MSKPLAIDLYAGLGGWAEGFLAEGFDVIGFDLEVHDYGTGGYPGQLVLQDVLSLHGLQFRDADIIVGSSPCQEFSYRAMPWKRAKALPSPELGMRLFEAQFRIQREACEAAGRYIPLVVENVKGAQPWVGRAKAHYGSYYLWGDIETVNGRIVCGEDRGFGCPKLVSPDRSAQKHNPDGTAHPQGSWFAVADSKNRGSKSSGQNWSRFTECGEVSPHWNLSAVKNAETCGGSWFNVAHDRVIPGNQAGAPQRGDGLKQSGLSGPAWFDRGAAAHSSKSNARKAASALIAKIPFELASYVAQSFHPGFSGRAARLPEVVRVRKPSSDCTTGLQAAFAW